MKTIRCCLILIILGLSSTAALANGIDPTGKLLGGDHSIILTSPNDPAFMINYVAGTPGITVDCQTKDPSAPTGHSCISPVFTDFINNTHQTFTAIRLDITAHNPSGTGGLVFLCNNAGDPYFDNCNSTTDPITGDPMLTFSGTTTHPGILPATSCTGTEIITCTGPTESDGTTILLYDFLTWFDVTDALTLGDTFHIQGTASVPEPSSVLLVLAGVVLLPFFKRS